MPPKADGPAAGATATIIILPVVRIERMLDAPGVKAKAARPVATPLNKLATKSAAVRKRRKRTALPNRPTQVCG